MCRNTGSGGGREGGVEGGEQRSKEDGVTLFSVVTGRRHERQWAQTKIQETPLKPKGKKISLQLIGDWNRLPREAMLSPSLDIFKTQADNILCNLF